MTGLLFLDFETYSATPLKTHGVYRYVEDPDFQPLMAAWSIDGQNVEVAVGLDEILSIPHLYDDDWSIVAHNASFERLVLSVIDPDRPAPHTYLDPSRFIDTAALAAEYGWPRALDKLAKALGVDPKDTAGTLLINTFSKPQRSGKRVYPEDKPEKWQQFIDYCRQDVLTLIQVYNCLPDWPTETERQLWIIDQIINDRGIVVDLDLVDKAVLAVAENAVNHTREIERITGLDNGNSVTQLLPWLQRELPSMADLTAESVSTALDQPMLSPQQYRVLELRQELALTAPKKFLAAQRCTSDDGRFRGGFKFYGAHTGRWSGQKIQLQNLPKDDPEATQAAILDLLLDNGADPKTLKALLRPMFTGPFTVVDYSAIEARVLAWLAGEKWAVEAFKDGRDIYTETAKRMGGLTRQQGKVAVLALGYGGSINSLRVMGAEGDDDDLLKLVYQWREANPHIWRFWNALKDAVLDGGKVGDHLRVVKDGKDRHLILPSGRSLCYHDVRNMRPLPHHRKPWDKQNKPTLYYKDYARGVALHPTYGGRLTENVTQAVARDVLADGILRIEHAGLEVAGHVHDEVIVYGDHLDEVKDLLTAQSIWAGGLPLAAEGTVVDRYRKI